MNTDNLRQITTSTLHTLVAAALLLLAARAQNAATTPPAQKPRGSIQGIVLGPLGRPVVGAKVWAALWPDLDRIIARGRTDGSGMHR